MLYLYILIDVTLLQMKPTYIYKYESNELNTLSSKNR